jgi:DNA-damage-inducible protein D
MLACKNSGFEIADHFPEVRKMIDTGKGARRKVKDFELSRYACCLIVQNGDSRKEVIALGQTYFAIQTYRQEIVDNH